MTMDPMNQPPGMEAPAPSLDPLDAGADTLLPPAAPSLVLSPEQLQQFGFAGLPDGSTVTAQVTFKTGLAGLEVQDVQNVAPVDANLGEPSPGEQEGTLPDATEDVAEGETPLGTEDAEEKAIGYKRPMQKSKKGGFPVDMKKLQSQF